MKRSALGISVAVLAIFVGILVFNFLKTSKPLLTKTENASAIQNLSGYDISRLEP